MAQLVTYAELDSKVSHMLGGDQYIAHSPYRGGLGFEAIRSKEVEVDNDLSIELGPVRTLRFSLLTGLLVGCVGDLWFRHVLLPNMPGWTYEVALRAAFDQTFFAPAVLAIVVGGTAMSTESAEAGYVRHKVSEDVSYLAGKLWTLWSSGVIISYLLVPTPWQPPFAASLAICWASYVSWRVHVPTRQSGFQVTHAPERVGAWLRGEQARAEW